MADRVKQPWEFLQGTFNPQQTAPSPQQTANPQDNNFNPQANNAGAIIQAAGGGQASAAVAAQQAAQQAAARRSAIIGLITQLQKSAPASQPLNLSFANPVTPNVAPGSIGPLEPLLTRNPDGTQIQPDQFGLQYGNTNQAEKYLLDTGNDFKDIFKSAAKFAARDSQKLSGDISNLNQSGGVVGIIGEDGKLQKTETTQISDEEINKQLDEAYGKYKQAIQNPEQLPAEAQKALNQSITDANGDQIKGAMGYALGDLQDSVKAALASQADQADDAYNQSQKEYLDRHKSTLSKTLEDLKNLPRSVFVDPIKQAGDVIGSNISARKSGKEAIKLYDQANKLYSQADQAIKSGNRELGNKLKRQADVLKAGADSYQTSAEESHTGVGRSIASGVPVSLEIASLGLAPGIGGAVSSAAKAPIDHLALGATRGLGVGLAGGAALGGINAYASNQDVSQGAISQAINPLNIALSVIGGAIAARPGGKSPRTFESPPPRSFDIAAERRGTAYEQEAPKTVFDSFEPKKTASVDTQTATNIITELAPKLKDTGSGGKQFIYALSKAASGVGKEGYGKARAALRAALYTPGKAAEAGAVRDIQQSHDFLKKIGIKADSAESTQLFRLLEGRTTNQEVIKTLGKDSGRKVVNAAPKMRQELDQKILKHNNSASPEEQIPYRENYISNLREASSEKGLPRDLFEGPTEPFYSKERKGGGEVKEDAVSAFLHYSEVMARKQHIDPYVSRLESAAGALEDANKPKLASSVYERAARLTGTQTEKASRIEKFGYAADNSPVGKVLDSVRRQVSRNILYFNFRLPALQIVDPLIEAFVSSPKSFAESLKKGGKIDQISDLAAERYADFHHGRTKFQRAQNFGGKPIEAADRFGVGRLNKQERIRSEKAGFSPEAAQAEADFHTAGKIGGRGKVDLPSLFAGKTSRSGAGFAYESLNKLYRLSLGTKYDSLYDGSATKATIRRYTQITALFAAWHMVNEVYKKVTGTPVLFDPIQALEDVAKDVKEGKNLEAAFRLPGEVLSQLPFGQIGASSLDLIGGPGTSQKVFSGSSVGYGGLGIPALAPVDTALKTAKLLRTDSKYNHGDSKGAILGRGLQDELALLASPFGGGKTASRVFDASTKLGNPYTSAGGSQLPFTPAATPGNFLKTVLGGLGNTKEGKEYFNKVDKLGFSGASGNFETFAGILDQLKKSGGAYGDIPSFNDQQKIAANLFIRPDGSLVSENDARKKIDRLRGDAKDLASQAYNKLQTATAQIKKSATSSGDFVEKIVRGNLSETDAVEAARKIGDKKVDEQVSDGLAIRSYLSSSAEDGFTMLSQMRARGQEPNTFLDKVQNYNVEAAQRGRSDLNTLVEQEKAAKSVKDDRVLSGYDENTRRFATASKDIQQTILARLVDAQKTDLLTQMAEGASRLNTDRANAGTIAASTAKSRNKNLFSLLSNAGMSTAGISAVAGGGSGGGGGRRKSSRAKSPRIKKPKKLKITVKAKKFTVKKPKKIKIPSLI